MPGDDHPVEVQNLRLQHPQLPAERRKTRPFTSGIEGKAEVWGLRSK